MPFEPGHKLGKGNKGARLIEEALRRAVTQEDGKRIREGVEKLLDMFAAGDLAAFDRIADRLDGKPHQSVTTDLNVNSDSREYSDDELRARVNRAELLLRSIGAIPAENGPPGPDSVH